MRAIAMRGMYESFAYLIRSEERRVGKECGDDAEEQW